MFQLAAGVPNSGCLGTQNLIAVRLCVTTVLKWLSTVTLGAPATKLFPGLQVTDSGVGVGYQYMLLEILQRISIAPDKLFRNDVCLLERAVHEERVSCLAQVSEFMSRNFCQ